MKLTYIITIVFFFINIAELQAQEHEWTETNTKWETAYMVTHIIDWGQTLEIAENPQYYELNPILGKQPTRGDVNKYFLLTGVGHYLISRYLDDWRSPWQKATFFLELGVIRRNAMMGIKINF